MRIVKSEKIFFSQKEADIWYDFEEILNGLKRECECPDILNTVGKILGHMSYLWEIVEGSVE